jgi:hypothetical protein
MQRKRSPFLPIVILFIILNGFFVAGKSMLDKWNTDQTVLIFGNLLLFTVTLISFLLAKRGLKSANPNAFVRSVYRSVMIKFFICAIVAFVYIQITKKQVNKPALFVCMGLYLVYSFLEVSVLTKMLRSKPHA